MNYHIEHHMFPMVPYHALPRLHALIKDDLPPPNPSMAHAYDELLRALWRQRHDPGCTIHRTLPPTAKPYRDVYHTLDVARSVAATG
jgi:fatty acid desaturase